MQPEELEDMVARAAIDPEAQRKIEEDRLSSMPREMFISGNSWMILSRAKHFMKGMDPEEVLQQLRREIFEAVMLHEIGMGLRHT